MAGGGKINWYVRRLKAMSAGEVLWRVGQKARAVQERVRFGRRYRAVDTPLYRHAARCAFDPAPLGLVFDSTHPIDTSHTIHLPGGFDYADYSTDWHAGFQTVAQWPVIWSYSLGFKQRDDIGDARTNWELNRHTQFALMAKAYYLTADQAHLKALQAELDSWTRRNPFLWGISWTSPMETAIRAINWLYAAAFLHESLAEAPDPGARAIMQRLITGAANMTQYLTRHYSRGSSANNHLLVEMAAIWLGGACLGKPAWCRLAMKVLSRELPRQFAPDGVNLEMSLHYHAFAMEAYLLVMHSARATGATVPDDWDAAIGRAARFVAHSRVTPGVMCSFGDDDEGHILHLSSRPADYYTYILQFSSLILNRRYDSLDELNPTLAWLFHADAVARVRHSAIYSADVSHTFVQGGYSMLRAGDIFAGFDHAPLGFGSIAAHGHADALSFQLFAGGEPLLVDPGTFIYHTDLPSRDAFRSTAVHNTVMTDDMEQSEMLGAFLWGRRATTTLLSHSARSVEASVTGLSGVTHTRRLDISDDGADVADSFSRPCRWTATFMVAPGINPAPAPDGIDLGGRARLSFSDGDAMIADTWYSPAYGIKIPARCIRISGHGQGVRFGIRRTHNS